ncbi:helix-turn-helix domain-containing protein [Cohnella hongkongensis]|uniref:Helix-turn-helix domain-containing protein n=1 Tax=Cohnella hongkongensis TaxID=178337 RepID=A0ABV9FIK4_9BACL
MIFYDAAAREGLEFAMEEQQVRPVQLRLPRSLTQEQLAESIGVSDAYIGQIERGERSPTLETLVKIASRLGVTIDYLLHDSLVPGDDNVIDQIRQLFMNRSAKEKQMALDVIKVMFYDVILCSSLLPRTPLPPSS